MDGTLHRSKSCRSGFKLFMKFIVELLAHGKDGEVREVDVPNLIKYSPRMVATEILQLIYEYGQNDNQPQEHPSVSVGDVMRVCDGLYLVTPTGFKHLSPTDYERYKAIPQNQRAVGLYLGNAISKL